MKSQIAFSASGANSITPAAECHLHPRRVIGELMMAMEQASFVREVSPRGIVLGSYPLHVQTWRSGAMAGAKWQCGDVDVFVHNDWWNRKSAVGDCKRQYHRYSERSGNEKYKNYFN